MSVYLGQWRIQEADGRDVYDWNLRKCTVTDGDGMVLSDTVYVGWSICNVR
jgi:hypothetical protein